MKCKYIYLSLFLLLLTGLAACDVFSNNSDAENDATLIWVQSHNKTEGADVAGDLIDESSMLSDGNSVYLLKLNLAKVNIKTGAILWRDTTLSNERDPTLFGGTAMRQTKSTIITWQQTKIHSISKKDGHIRWMASTERVGPHQDIYNTVDVPLAITSSKILVGDNQKIDILDRSNGSKELEVPINLAVSNNFPEVISSIAANRNSSLAFVSTKFKNGSDSIDKPSNLSAFNFNTGSKKWTFDLSNIITATDSTLIQDLQLTDNSLFVLTTHEVLAIAPNTGKIKWQTPFNNKAAIVGSHFILKGNNLYVNISSGSVMKINGDDGSIIWKTTILKGHTIFFRSGHMILSSNHLYLPCKNINKNNFGGDVYAIKVLSTSNGNIERSIKGSDIKGAQLGVLYSRLNGILVKDSILVKQGGENTYGINLNHH